MVHSRIAPSILPQLHRCQGGFCWGADIMAGSLIDVLHMRSATHTFVAFVDIFKAFDTCWVEATMVELFSMGVHGRMWALIAHFVHGTFSQVRSGSHLSEPWRDSGIAQGSVLSPLLFNILVDGLARVHDACPGVSLMASWDSRFTGQLYADDLVVVAYSAADLQTGLDAVSALGFRYRFTFGVVPSKSAAMIFGPRRNLPACNVTLGGIALPVVSEYKYLGVVLSPTMSWAAHVQHVVNRGNRLFAQCVSWCRAERLPLHMASSIFVLPSIAWGSEFLSASPTALKSLDRALRRWGWFLLGWPTGSPNVGVLVELGWPDAERISSCRLLSLFGRVTSMISGPIPVAVFQAASRMPRTWANCALNMCHSLGAPLPNACVSPNGGLSAKSVISLMMVCTIALQWALHLVHCPPSAFSVGRSHNQRTDSSPDHARVWGLARWGHDPCPEGRPTRHLQLPVDCRFCHAPVGDLVHCLSECPWFEDLRTEWCRRCGIPVQAASVWSQHSWIFDTTSLLNSQETLRAHVRFCWCSVSAIL